MCLIIIPRSYLQKYCLFETFRLKSQSPLKVKIYSVFRVRVSDLIRQFGFGSLQTGFGFFGFGLPSSFGSVASGSGSGFGFARTRPVRNTNPSSNSVDAQMHVCIKFGKNQPTPSRVMERQTDGQVDYISPSSG